MSSIEYGVKCLESASEDLEALEIEACKARLRQSVSYLDANSSHYAKAATEALDQFGDTETAQEMLSHALDFACLQASFALARKAG